jgi:hypothetical protein
VIRLTYDNNVMKQYLTRHSFKHWMWPLRAPKEDWVTSDKAFKLWSIGVPNDGVSVKRVDILHAPRAWLGLHARNPQVITSWVKGVGEVVPEEKYASTDDFAESSVEVTVQAVRWHRDVRRRPDARRYLREREGRVRHAHGGEPPPDRHSRARVLRVPRWEVL